MSRAQLKHLLLDVSFKDKPKIIDLEVEFKPIARLLLMDILAACSAASNAEITINVCKHLGNRIGIEAESVEKILDYCIKHDILFAVNGKITNSRVIKDQESYYNKLESDRKRKDSKRIPTGNNCDPDIDFDIDNDLDLNLIKEDPQAVKAIARWVEHRFKIGKPLDQMAVDSLILLYRGKLSELPDDVDHSISNGWKTLNAKPRQLPQKTFKPQEPSVRRVINNYVPPTAAERRKLTPEQIAANKRLIEEKLGKIKGVA